MKPATLAPKPFAEPLPITAAVHGPYEDLAIAGLRVLEKIIDLQPKEIQAELWRAFLVDLKAWREFWKRPA